MSLSRRHEDENQDTGRELPPFDALIATLDGPANLPVGPEMLMALLMGTIQPPPGITLEVEAHVRLRVTA